MAVLKFEPNVPRTWTFPKGDFVPKESTMYPGTFQHMCTVVEDGEQHVHFADEKLKTALLAAGMRPGATFTITKGKEPDGKTNKYTVTGAGGATTTNSAPQAAPRAAGSTTFSDISYAYRECLFAASAHLTELASLDGETPRLVDYAVIQAAAATMMIQADRAGCLPPTPKAKPNLDGPYTKAFLAWLAEYRNRADISPVWPGGNGFVAFIEKAAGKQMVPFLEMNDPEAFKQVETLILAETANRAEQAAASAPMESGEAEIPF